MFSVELENAYDVLWGEINPELSIVEFNAPQKEGGPVLLRVRIEPYGDPLLPGVYNLSLGPPDENGEINDHVRLRHHDSARVYSTVILFALAFLTEYPEASIGLDGSNDIRANLYHSMFLLNRNAVSEYFDAVGVDWYVKLLRNQQDVERDHDGNPFFKPRPEEFDYTRTRADLYRYYILQLKSK